MYVRIIWFFCIVMLLSSCSGGFSKGVKKDLSTGLSTSYNGFSLDEIYLTDTKGTRLPDNKISIGSPLAVVVTGVDHFEVKEGRVFPGCSIVLTDEKGAEILKLPDAFADMKDGYTVAEASVLSASLNTGAPMVAGETYHLQVRFFDKLRKDSEIISSVDIQLKD